MLVSAAEGTRPQRPRLDTFLTPLDPEILSKTTGTDSNDLPSLSSIHSIFSIDASINSHLHPDPVLRGVIGNFAGLSEIV